MPRSIWSGAISFGLVNVPVKLYSSVNRKTVRFHQLNRDTGHRVAQKRVDSVTNEEVAYENIVKGYELTKDRYVVITPEELETLDPEKSRTIDIEDFVDLSEIDPIYYDKPYYLVPDKGAAKSYALLLKALEKVKKVAIASCVIRNREHIFSLKPLEGQVLLLEQMRYADEIKELPDIKETAHAKITPAEINLAVKLIDQLTE